MGRGRGESITRQGINQSTEINDKLGDSPPKVLLPSPLLSPVPSSRCSLPLHSHSVLHSPTPYLSFALAPYLLSGRYHQVPTKCSSTDNYKQINSMCAAMRRCPPLPPRPYTPTPLRPCPNPRWGMAATLSKININENAENLIEELGHLL